MWIDIWQRCMCNIYSTLIHGMCGKRARPWKPMFMDACDATPVHNSNIDDPIGYKEAKRSLFPTDRASNHCFSLIPHPKTTNDFEVSKVICNEKNQHHQPASAVLPSVWKFWSFWFSLAPREWCETLDNVLWLPKRSSAWVSWFLVCIFNPVACSRMLAERIWSPSTLFDAWQRQGWVKPGCLISWQIFGSCFIINHWFSYIETAFFGRAVPLMNEMISGEAVAFKHWKPFHWQASASSMGWRLLVSLSNKIYIISLSLYCHILSYSYVLRRRTPLLWQPVRAPLGGPPPKSISCMYELYGCTVMQCNGTTTYYHCPLPLSTTHSPQGVGYTMGWGGSGVSNTTVSHINTQVLARHV